MGGAKSTSAYVNRSRHGKAERLLIIVPDYSLTKNANYFHIAGVEGRKFRRQHSIGKYILDFYCPSERLAIELDGEHHFTDEGMEYDKKAY